MDWRINVSKKRCGQISQNVEIELRSSSQEPRLHKLLNLETYTDFHFVVHLHFTFVFVYTERKITPSLGYVRVKRWKEQGRARLLKCHRYPSLPSRLLAGQKHVYL